MSQIDRSREQVVTISRILVAVDGSENADRAFEYAAYIAKQCEAERLFYNQRDRRIRSQYQCMGET